MKYAFCGSVSWGYMYGMNATINAMKYYGVNADWELAYGSKNSDMLAYMKNASKYFPFKVNWTDLGKLNARYKGRYGEEQKPNEFWLGAYALVVDKIDDYDAICLIQGDEFLAYGVESFFRAVAGNDNFIITEHFGNMNCIEDLPFGQENEIYIRSHHTVTDQLIFASRANKRIFEYCVKSQLKKPIKGHEHDPTTALNRALAKYLTPGKIMPLERNLWAFQGGSKKLRYENGRIYNQANCRIKGWHNRWWQDGRLVNEMKRTSEENSKIIRHNAGIARKAMEFFNNLTPETRIEPNWKIKI